MIATSLLAENSPSLASDGHSRAIVRGDRRLRGAGETAPLRWRDDRQVLAREDREVALIEGQQGVHATGACGCRDDGIVHPPTRESAVGSVVDKAAIAVSRESTISPVSGETFASISERQSAGERRCGAGRRVRTA